MISLARRPWWGGAWPTYWSPRIPASLSATPFLGRRRKERRELERSSAAKQKLQLLNQNLLNLPRPLKQILLNQEEVKEEEEEEEEVVKRAVARIQKSP